MTWPSGDPAYSAPPPPPPLPYQHGPHGQHPHPQRKSRKGLIIALIVGFVVIGAVLAFVVLRYATKDRVGAAELAVGECIATIPTGDLVAQVPTVDCAEPHAGEVFAVLTVPGTSFPGQATIGEWQNKCPAALTSYVSAPQPDGSVKVFVLYPTEQTWGHGDRVVTCIATTDVTRTGSLKTG